LVLAPCLFAKKGRVSTKNQRSLGLSAAGEQIPALWSGRVIRQGKLGTCLGAAVERRRQFRWKLPMLPTRIHCLGSAAVVTRPIGSRSPSQHEPSLAPPSPFSERHETINRNQSQRQRYPHLHVSQPKCLIYHLQVSTKHPSMIKTAATNAMRPTHLPLIRIGFVSVSGPLVEWYDSRMHPCIINIDTCTVFSAKLTIPRLRVHPRVRIAKVPGSIPMWPSSLRIFPFCSRDISARSTRLCVLCHPLARSANGT
jgi:hypothetical protein